MFRYFWYVISMHKWSQLLKKYTYLFEKINVTSNFLKNWKFEFARKCKTQIGAKTHIKCSSIQIAGRLIFFRDLFSILKTETADNRCGSRKGTAQICFFVPECMSCGINFNLKHYCLCDHQFGMCTLYSVNVGRLNKQS